MLNDTETLPNVTTTTQLSSQPNGWPFIYSQYVLDQLKDFVPTSKPVNNFTSYKIWASLNESQLNKVVSFVASLNDEDRERLFEKAIENSVQANIVTNSRQQETNKHDKCRLIHLFVEAECQANWTRTLTPLDR